MIPAVDNAHVTEGQGLLTSRYASAATVKGIVTALMTRFQQIENDYWALVNAVQLANHPMAGGPWSILDQLGTIVGVVRNGLDDADFLAVIKLQARANRARGLAEDVIGMGALMQGGTAPLYLEMPPAAFYLGCWNVALNYPLFTPLLKQVRPAAVYAVFLYSTWPDGHDFEWGSRYDATAGEAGWGSRYDATAGGPLVAAVVI